ncbi:MAG TPA: Pr6Pr family membrane protein [Sphingomicrobium sp.]
MQTARMTAGVVALVAWAGLILQFWIIVGNLGLGLAIWRFVGFFTILTNIGVASIATAIAIGSGNRLTTAKARLMGLTSIALVGLVYSLLLRSLWSPTGLQKVADMTLHDVTPILFAALWLLMPHGELRWSDFKWALIPPAAYLGYAFARGAIDGWYAYWFLNPTTQTAGELIISIVGVLALFSIIAAGAIALDRQLGKKTRLARAA